jgi:hypothetical protein
MSTKQRMIPKSGHRLSEQIMRKKTKKTPHIRSSSDQSGSGAPDASRSGAVQSLASLAITKNKNRKQNADKRCFSNLRAHHAARTR